MDGYGLVLARLRAGLRQYQLAQLLGVPPTVISNLERGLNPITPEIEREISAAIKQAQGRPVASGLIRQTRAALRGRVNDEK